MPPSPLPRATTSVAALLAFTFISSVSSGVLTSGTSLLATATYHFDARANYALASLVGITYVLGARATVPLLERLRAVATPRTILAGLVTALGLLALLPAVAPAEWGSAPLWLLVGLYSPTSGAVWPITQSYLSSDGRDVLRWVPRYNVTWAGAVMLGFAAMAPWLGRAPLTVFVLLGLAHLLSIATLVGLRPSPGGASTTPSGPNPQADPELLRLYRAFLPASYLWMCALGPSLPGAGQALGLSLERTGQVATLWTVARVAVFAGLALTPLWRGRRAMPWVGGALLVSGLALAAVAPWVPMVGTALLGAALLAFGTGMGLVYTGALTYALLAGPADVRAGSKHEALIGVGYAVGPLCGLIAHLFAPAGGAAASGLLVALALGAGGGLVTWGLRRG